MTLIAAVYPPGDCVFFLCDTLISTKGQFSGRMLGPSGVIRPRPNVADYHPERLEQKCIIINKRTFAAYAGASFLGKIVIRKLVEGLAHCEPSRSTILGIIADYETELNVHDTSVLIAFVEDGRYGCITLGPKFMRSQLPDGTVCLAAGSGAEAFLRDFPVICSAKGAIVPRSLDPYHALIMRICGLTGNYFTHESFSSEFESHFGGIIEIIRRTKVGFEKFPGATIIAEVIELGDDALTIVGGNFADFCYYDDLLVFRRFGQIRANDAVEAFGTDYFIDTVNPPHRKATSKEHERATTNIQAKSFQNSEVFIFSWIDPATPEKGQMRVSTPDIAGVEIGRTNDQFWIFRSRNYLRYLAKRFRVKKVYVGNRDSCPAYPPTLRSRAFSLFRRLLDPKRQPFVSLLQKRKK